MYKMSVSVSYLRLMGSIFVSCILIIMLSQPSWGADTDNNSIECKVLRVFSVKKSPYYHKPWKSPDFSQVKGSGFFFRDDRNFPNRKGLILTNAHTVSMSESVQVSNGKEKRRYEAKLVGICNSADFAVLEMDPNEFKSYEERNGEVVPLDLGDSDQLRVGDKVLGWGYPLGGERISKSEAGEISRIEVSRYAYSQELWLMVQASLQQNQGNSGGPVLKDGKVVGISFQGMKIGDRINYFIPINIVKNLLPTLEDERAIPHWRYMVQFMFPRLKDYFGLKPDQGGILVDFIIPEGGPYKFGIRKDDILTEIEGRSIDSYGDIYFEPLGQRVYFSEILNRKKVGDPLTIKVIRDSRTIELSGAVTQGLPKLVPKIFTTANYFIMGGVGFVELTTNCIENMGKSGEPFQYKYQNEFPKKPGEKIVIISEIFPEYGLTETSGFLNRVLKAGDQDILNIEGLHALLDEKRRNGEKRVLLELAGNMRLPLDLQSAQELDAQIKNKYGILYMKTPDGFFK